MASQTQSMRPTPTPHQSRKKRPHKPHWNSRRQKSLAQLATPAEGEGPTTQRPDNYSRGGGEGPARRQEVRQITLSVHNVLTREPDSTTRGTQWYPSRSMSCAGNDGVVHQYPLRAEFPRQTVVPWQFVAHIPRRRQWSLSGMETAWDTLQ